MGQKSSQHHQHHHHRPPAAPAETPPPPPPPTFDEPWRKISWDGRDEMLDQLKDFVPRNPHIPHVRILLHGPVGVGKSSFVNSINNVFQNRITSVALVASGMEGKSFTTRYKTHKIENREQSGSSYCFVFNDIMGLEDANGEGMHTYDIVSALKGHVKDGYKFSDNNRALSADDAFHRKSPGLGDKAHCLVSLIAADKLSVMSDDVIQKMRAIRLEASDLGIPQIVILTRVDLACPLVKMDLRNVYKSKYMKELMEKCSVSLGVPVNCILPVRNYHEETDLDSDTDALLLRALRQTVDFADNYSNDVPLSGAMAVLVPLRQYAALFLVPLRQYAALFLVPLRQYAALFLVSCVQLVRDIYERLKDWNTQRNLRNQPTGPVRRRLQSPLQTHARQFLRREAVQ